MTHNSVNIKYDRIDKPLPGHLSQGENKQRFIYIFLCSVSKQKQCDHSKNSRVVEGRGRETQIV